MEKYELLSPKGHHKTARISEIVKELDKLKITNWWLSNKLELGETDELIDSLDEALSTLSKFLNLELWETSTPHVEEISKKTHELRQALEMVLNQAPISSSVFTSKLEFARIAFPLVVELTNIIRDLYDSAEKNALAYYEYEASCFDGETNYSKVAEHLAKMYRKSQESPTVGISMLGVDLSILLDLSSRFFHGRSQSLVTELHQGRIK